MADLTVVDGGSMIQRYDIIMEGCEGWCRGKAVADPCEEGDYVTHADHLAEFRRGMKEGR